MLLFFIFFLEKGGRENNTFLVLSINLCINEKRNYSTVFERNFMHIPFEEWAPFKSELKQKY